jgi:hypothetical protein
MSKKMFLRRALEIPTAYVTAVRSEPSHPATSSGNPVFEPVQHGGLAPVNAPSAWAEATTPATSGERLGFESPEQEEPPTSPSTDSESSLIESRQPLFKILNDRSKTIKKYNTTGRTMQSEFSEPTEAVDPMSHLTECVTALNDYLARGVNDRDMVGISIQNTVNVTDKSMWISCRRRDQLKPDVIMEVLAKVIQSNARFGLSDSLEIHVDYVKMASGNGHKGILKTKGQSLGALGVSKRSIVQVKAKYLCLAHSLVFALSQFNRDPLYKSYRNGYLLAKPVSDLKASGVDLTNGGGIEELKQFQAYLSDYKIIVYDVLSPDGLMFTGNSLSAKKLYLLYDDENGEDHYNVIANITGNV